LTAGIKANVDGSAAIQVGGVDAITLTSAGAASFVTSPMTIQGGSAAAPSLTFSGDTNTGIFSPAADTIAFTEGGVESMRIDASGRLLIGGTSGSAILTVVGGTQMIHTFTGASAAFAWGQFDSSGNASINNQANANLLFATNNTERARITSAGYGKFSNDGTYLGATGVYHEFRQSSSNANITVFSSTAAGPYGNDIAFTAASPNNTTNYFLLCYDTTNNKAIIYSNGTVTNRTGTYNAFSDLKLKQDVVDANSQWDDIKALRIVKYRLKDEVAADPNYPSYIGLIAQEVEQVSPGLVDNCPDFETVEVTDEEGNVTTERRETGTVTKSVKSSIVYMKAVKALQEAMDRIEKLEAEVALLKGAA
jgi:hypothetical protein